LHGVAQRGYHAAPIRRAQPVHNDTVTSATAAWLVAAAAFAVANWWSRWSHHRPTELWSKPLTLLALIGAAIALDPIDPAVRGWFVVALVLSLAGDVFLLGDESWFVPGLAAFLAGHVAYVVGFVFAEEWRWWYFALAAIGVAVLAIVVGRRIVAGAVERRPALRVPVASYLGVISLMAASAAATDNAWAVTGALLFLTSDTILGWRQFVSKRPWMPVAIMVTYHLAQATLVISLV
jgi:uncharacterized membrane protein YhhN